LEDWAHDPAARRARACARRLDEGSRASETQAASSLRRAIRRARLEEAERADVIAELRGAEMARLEMLRDALAPLLDEVPPHIDLFDVAIMPGEHPRLFIDMIGFVEIGEDRRAYRFVQDTRHGRLVLAESESIDKMSDAVADYMAHRLLEREKALACDGRSDRAARLRRAARGVDLAVTEDGGRVGVRKWPAWRREKVLLRGVLAFLSFAIEILGSAAFFMLLAIGGWQVWKTLAALGAAH